MKFGIVVPFNTTFIHVSVTDSQAPKKKEALRKIYATCQNTDICISGSSISTNFQKRSNRALGLSNSLLNCQTLELSKCLTLELSNYQTLEFSLAQIKVHPWSKGQSAWTVTWCDPHARGYRQVCDTEMVNDHSILECCIASNYIEKPRK